MINKWINKENSKEKMKTNRLVGVICYTETQFLYWRGQFHFPAFCYWKLGNLFFFKPVIFKLFICTREGPSHEIRNSLGTLKQAPNSFKMPFGERVRESGRSVKSGMPEKGKCLFGAACQGEEMSVKNSVSEKGKCLFRSEKPEVPFGTSW